ncbi:MAG: xanthine dehydrogenase, partial [Rhodospirillales bacterium]|nr:xanthine dehydrogenase [Rhodospirillales bacterium]
TATRAVPGVLDVLTYESKLTLEPDTIMAEGGFSQTSIMPLRGPEIAHDGQIVAVVVGDTFEAAREGAYALRVTYEAAQPAAGFDAPGATEVKAKDAKKQYEDLKVGDVETALRGADTVLDAVYETPTQHHNPIELFSSTAVWVDGKVTIYEPSQNVYGFKNGLAKNLKLDPDQVRVVSEFVGGAFGSKGSLHPRTALAAHAAWRLQRPVRLVLTRDQGFTNNTYRAETRHHIRLGANKDGKLVGYAHQGWEVTSRADPYLVAGTDTTAHMYAFGAVGTEVSIIHADRNTPGFMRSPPETPYMYALEQAMDEMAVKLGLDPVEFRRINDTMKDPISGKPYSSRKLMQCYDAAAAAFGWAARDPRPGSMRDGDWLIGWGCATACYPTSIAPAAVRVRLTSEGHARVQIAAHDVGTGLYTVAAQQASEALGVKVANVTVELGDSDLPPGPVAGGSNSTASVCSAILKACGVIRARLANAAVATNEGPLAGLKPADLRLTDGKIVSSEGKSEPLPAVFDRLESDAIEEYAENVPEGGDKDGVRKLYHGHTTMVRGGKAPKLRYSFGAEFVEVRVHARTREVRVPRIVGAFTAGKIMNPRTARSQLMGGMIWGIASALHEATEIDPGAARYVNHNIAEYLIPVNADVRDVQVLLLSETDTELNPAGVKGLGELGNVGTAAAVASAVYHATGKRIRNLPIRIDDLLEATA